MYSYVWTILGLAIILFVAYLWLFDSSFFLNKYYYSSSAGSKSDGFLIDFPLKPTVKQNSLTPSVADGGISSLSEYSYNDASFNQQYYVLVNKYNKDYTNLGGFSTPNLANFLSTDIAFRASLVSGEKVISDTTVNFKNTPAQKAEIKCDNETCYELEFPDTSNNS